MKTDMKKCRWPAVLLATVIMLVMIAGSGTIQAKNNDYDIRFYDVDITVNEDNTFRVKEKIVTWFYYERHGIIRTLPLSNKVIRNDGTSSTNKVEISDVTVKDWKYTLDKSTSSQQLKIKIGSSDVYISGEQTFEISYTYDIGKDPVKDYDEFYFNIIGCLWDTEIKEVHFRITFPKEFDPEKVGFAHGPERSQKWENVYYNILEGNTVIEGSYFETLKPYEGLTVRMELPEGYFIRPFSWKTLARYSWFLFPLVIAMAYFVIFMIWGRDDTVIDSVEFYPPDGIDPLDMAFFYKGHIDEKDVTSLLIYLANAGYISIDRNGTNYDIICLEKPEYPRDPNGNNIGYFYYHLYMLGSKNSDGTRIVTSKMMRNNFYHTTEHILDFYNNEIRKKEIIKENRALKLIGAFMGLTMVLMPLVLVLYDSIDIYKLFVPFFLTFWYGIFLLIAYYQYREGHKFGAVILGLFALAHFIIIINAITFNGLLISLMSDPVNLLLTVISEGLAVSVLYMARFMDKRNEYGNKILGRIRGFRNFLLTCEKDRLEQLVDENPHYFYDILPYAYVLGVSKHWIEQFEDLVTGNPGWLYAGYSYDSFDVNDFVHDGLNDWSRQMTHKPISVRTSSSSSSSTYYSSSDDSYSSGYSSSDYSSSSSDSGGGSSGGGSGGGGGTSW